MVEFGKPPSKIKQAGEPGPIVYESPENAHKVTGSLGIGPLTVPACDETNLSVPVYRSKLIFLDENLVTISWPNHRPNPWWRLWHWVFFGIKWENLDDEQTKDSAKTR